MSARRRPHHREPGVLLAVQTADCIPILLADTKTPRHRRDSFRLARHACAASPQKRSAACKWNFGTRPADVIAAIGPGIGRCCYEVGVEVVKEFAAQFPEARDWFDGPFDALASGEAPELAPLALHVAARPRAAASYALIST